MNIIINEVEWVERMLLEHTFDCRPSEAIDRYARYLNKKGCSKEDMQRKIEEMLLRNDSGVSLQRWREKIKDAIRRSNRPLVELDGVTITKAEIDKINELDSVSLRKIAFTIVCLAKYCNAVRGDQSNWIFFDPNAIAPLACISFSNDQLYSALGKLCDLGYINLSHMVSSHNIHVNIIDDSSEEALVIDDFRNIGYQYLMYMGEDYIRCELCGLVIRRTSGRQMYCKKCRERMIMEKQQERRKTAKI